MRRMDEEDENKMLTKFRIALETELEKHRMGMTVQWPQLSIGTLMRKAQEHYDKAWAANERADYAEAQKHLAHAGNYLAMAFDNLGACKV